MPDVVIHDAHGLTVDDRYRPFERGPIVVEDGRIVEVRQSRDDDAGIPADRVLDGRGKLAMPGLVNAHAHLESTPLIGAFGDLGVGELLTGTTGLFARIADGEFDDLVAAGYELAALDVLRGGVTTVFCYWNPDPELQWAPVPERRAAGVGVGLGIDDHYWHDSYDVFDEARQARLAANLEGSAARSPRRRSSER